MQVMGDLCRVCGSRRPGYGIYGLPSGSNVGNGSTGESGDSQRGLWSEWDRRRQSAVQSRGDGTSTLSSHTTRQGRDPRRQDPTDTLETNATEVQAIIEKATKS